MKAWQVESTIPHLADLHLFVWICSVVSKADPLPNCESAVAGPHRITE